MFKSSNKSTRPAPGGRRGSLCPRWWTRTLGSCAVQPHPPEPAGAGGPEAVLRRQPVGFQEDVVRELPRPQQSLCSFQRPAGTIRRPESDDARLSCRANFDLQGPHTRLFGRCRESGQREYERARRWLNLGRPCQHAGGAGVDTAAIFLRDGQHQPGRSGPGGAECELRRTV